jgi:ribulose-5-phosphate 4-epimerase/fuculose-1-phosphate aldolase
VTPESEVIAAAGVLAAAGLVDAFGHVSARAGDRILMTPPQPLGALGAGEPLVTLDPAADELPAGVPKEAWIHLAIYDARPDVEAICRAQPPNVAAAAVSGTVIRALHGQGAFAGRAVPVFDDARLVRDRERGRRLARALADAPALVMRGNGAITVGAAPGIAAARMYVLEASARINLQAAAAGGAPRPLSDEEFEAWSAVADEILGRLWTHLRGGRD